MINKAYINKLIETSIEFAKSANNCFAALDNDAACAAAQISQAYSQAALAEMKFQETNHDQKD